MKLLKRQGEMYIEIAGDFEHERNQLHERFYKDPDIARYEETRYENGTEGVSIKNAYNKIIEQVKTIKT